MTRRSRLVRRISVGGVRTRDVAGVSVLPPPGLAAAIERIRAWMAVAHRALVPAPVRILDAMLAPLDAAALSALCRLGVPGAVRGGVELDQLATQVGVDRARLGRLVGYAHARGWLRLDRQGRVHATRVTRFLRPDHPGGWWAWVDWASGPDVLGALTTLGHQPRALDPFAHANGAPFFEWCAQHPEREAAFDTAMTAGARLHGLALATTLNWSNIARVCDIGGGTGALLRVLIAAHPQLHGVLVERPPVAARTPPTERITVRAVDAFAYAEPGCDRYLFVNVVHDWDDDHVVQLLAQVRRAVPEHGEVIVLEHERRMRPRSGIALSTDLLMLALTPGGHERTTPQIIALAARAGWTHHQRLPLPSGDYAHVLIPHRT